ncbi:hypothetical protein RJ640_018177 [Escallonia rubra]|uniref:Uncharacterized protein n=1 Tax=Escallonia rubra TaxID=112253 RepID=A0AA88UAY9_9ASTE|nr:hypothetical protein RJ640_018177 [Escallonia rubra]
MDQFQAESESSRQSTSQSAQNEGLKEWQDAWDVEDKREIKIQGIDHHDAFWEKLRLAAGKKVSAAEAEGFCKSFQGVYKKLVEELSLDAAQSFINASKHNHEA